MNSEELVTVIIDALEEIKAYDIDVIDVEILGGNLFDPFLLYVIDRTIDILCHLSHSFLNKNKVFRQKS